MILQGMVLLLVLIHPLVSQTGDLVCIRAFFRVEGKAAAGADRQKTACNMIGCCNSLTDKLDLAALQLHPFRFLQRTPGGFVLSLISDQHHGHIVNIRAGRAGDDEPIHRLEGMVGIVVL